MAERQPCQVHPTAIVSGESELGEGVVIGPYAILEGPVQLGPGCVIRPHAFLCGPIKMGRGNIVFPGAVIGERPQHLKYNDEPTGVEIGHHNVFRENVTIHRGTVHSWVTRIGDNNFLMAGSHIAHDCQVGNNCILANNALLGGHCQLANNVYISGNSAVHQFTRIGRLALLSGCSATTKDMPPFIIQQGINTVDGVNVVGMRRAGMSDEHINAVKRAFRILFREELTLPVALAKVEKELGNYEPVQEMLTFLHDCPKGINGMRNRSSRAQAA
jgi:UDP-N-acetylglucosamine acyltransferase